MKSKRSIQVTIVIVSMLLLATLVYFRQRAPSPLPSATKSAVATNSVATTERDPRNPASLSQAVTMRRDKSRLVQVDLMRDVVGLTDEQANKVESILEKQQTQMAAFRRETSLSRQQRIERLRGMRESDVAQLKSVLTAEQFEKWSKRGLELQKALR